jgi:hypothetical protein
MAKKQQAPDAIIKQFEKPQFNVDDAVFFTWLGAKKYGYVKTYKTSSWGIQYLVESNDTRYPCGISIKGHKTAYTTGCINIDETRSIGQDELTRRIQTGHSSTYTELFTDTRRTEDESGSKSAVANTYLQQILKQSNHPDLTIREKMLLNLALMEILRELEKNEEILNLTMQSNVSEIS